MKFINYILAALCIVALAGCAGLVQYFKDNPNTTKIALMVATENYAKSHQDKVLDLLKIVETGIAATRKEIVIGPELFIEAAKEEVGYQFMTVSEKALFDLFAGYVRQEFQAEKVVDLVILSEVLISIREVLLQYV